MIEARKVANKIESEREKAIAYHDTIVPALEEIRYHIDKLELDCRQSDVDASKIQGTVICEIEKNTVNDKL